MYKYFKTMHALHDMINHHQIIKWRIFWQKNLGISLKSEQEPAVKDVYLYDGKDVLENNYEYMYDEVKNNH